jgi:hypothetical protein
MKRTLLAFFLLLLTSIRLFAAESEPNDVRGDADKLNLNSSNTGAIGVPGDVDWWKVTTNVDGELDITLTVSNSLFCYFQLYDNNATTLLVSDYTNGTKTIDEDGLAPGTYYIYIYAYTAGQMPAYTIANALNVAPLAVDAEPNGLYTQANAFPLNGSSTGHIGYYYDGVRDTTDWWSIVTTGNGELELTMASGNGQYLYWVLYDGNGSTVLKSNYTSGTSTHVTDGLAAGTYYVKVYGYSTDGFAPYTLTSVFNVPPVSNDTEPNNTKAQAKNLPLNNARTGQVGYYYNGVRDTSDWFKVTTDLDGDLELTIKSENGEYVYCTLYDKNGTTVISSNYTSGTLALNSYGLTAGTYYLRMYCYYNYKWADYTISDTLTLAPVANDVEPNNSKGTAIVFAENSTMTGHVGYYYDLERDTADWYEIVTSNDGQIVVTLTPEIGEYVYATLYDEDGTTILANHYSSTNTLTSKDGLAAGTYYVSVYCYYNYKYAPYTITNVVNTYINDNDGISNEEPKKAATLPANIAVEGHVGFRFNGGLQDASDWWKINYTGNSDLTVALNWEPRLCCGLQYVYLKIYADTAAAPIFNQYTASGNVTANLTGLDKQYYYVQVITYYATEFAAYNLTATFTQKEKAKITLLSSAAGTDCSNGTLEYKCTKSEKPYTVQLFRNGKKYGNAFIVKNSNAFTLDTLLPGNYYATVYGDGATGQGKGTSVTTTIVPVPSGLSTTKIKTNKAQLNWDTLACVDYDSVYYRVQGTTTWTKKETANNNSAYTISGLTASTTYEWMVAHVVDTAGEKATGSYSAIVSFTTKPLKLGDVETTAIAALAVFPNPASEMATITYTSNYEGALTFKFFDAVGRSIETWTIQSAEGEYTRELNLVSLAPGIYYVRVTGGNADQTIKIVKQ